MIGKGSAAMGNPLEERLRTVERDWDELHRQNNQLIELNNALTRERDRLREALLLVFNAASADALAGAAPDYRVAVLRARALAPDTAKEG
jgi:regulator of replication initiation timing